MTSHLGKEHYYSQHSQQSGYNWWYCWDDGVIFQWVMIHPNLLQPRHTSPSTSPVSAHFGEGIHSHTSSADFSDLLLFCSPTTHQRQCCRIHHSAGRPGLAYPLCWHGAQCTCIFSRYWVRSLAYCSLHGQQGSSTSSSAPWERSSPCHQW